MNLLVRSLIKSTGSEYASILLAYVAYPWIILHTSLVGVKAARHFRVNDDVP